MLSDLDEKMNSRKQAKMNEEAYNDKKRKAALTIIKHWRNKKKQASSIFNVSTVLQVQQGKTQGIVHLKDKIQCNLCNERLAIRLCDHCTDESQKLFCVECFKSYHARGARKRHDRKRIVYEGQPLDANQSVMSKKALSESQS